MLHQFNFLGLGGNLKDLSKWIEVYVFKVEFELSIYM